MIMETNLCVNRSCGMTNVRSAAGRECSHNTGQEVGVVVPGNGCGHARKWV